MKTCSACHEIKEYACFYRNKRTKDGYQASCKKCADKGNTASRHKHPENARRVRMLYQHAAISEVRAWKEKEGCLHCPENDPWCLDMHHLDPAVKDDHPSMFAKSSLKRFLVEAKKCVVLCKNCHTKVHANRISLDPLKIEAFQRKHGWC